MLIYDRDISKGPAVAETLWDGRPEVDSNVRGLPPQIIDGENGFLVNPYNNQGFADRIMTILQDPGLSKEMGKKGKELVRKKFLKTRLLADFLDLLTEIM